MLSLEKDTLQAESSEQAVHSRGAVIEVMKTGAGVGMPMMSVACPPSTSFLSTVSSPVYSMQLRGFAGSRV